MGIRLKILLGFVILALMLSVAGIVSIHELSSIGKSVEQMIDENYKSIQASNIMLESLEREDSGVLLLMLGQWEEGRKIISQSDSMFLRGFMMAKHNLTLKNENVVINAIEKSYYEYKYLWERPIVGTEKEGDISWYYKNSHDSFLKIKHSVKQLMYMNQDAMYETSTVLKNRSKRAAMPGIVAIISSLVFVLLFNYYIHFYIAKPIIQINKNLEDYIEYKKPFTVKIESHDEIEKLAETIEKSLK